MRLHDRTILVTGGTSGIGYELVRQLHAGNNRIIVIARNRQKLADLAAEFPGIVIRPCDLTKKMEVEDALLCIASKHPELSVIFNNAAIQYNPAFLSREFSHDSIEAEITTNFTAPMWIISFLLPILLQQENAAIINITTGLAIYPKTSSAVYSATKAAMHSASQSLRYQLEKTDVRVFEAIMTLVDTPMTEGRNVNKMSAARAAADVISGVENNCYENYIGKARLLPILSRISPALTKAIMKNA